MRSIETTISIGLLNELIKEFLVKNSFVSNTEDIDKFQIDWKGGAKPDHFHLSYTVKEV